MTPQDQATLIAQATSRDRRAAERARDALIRDKVERYASHYVGEASMPVRELEAIGAALTTFYPYQIALMCSPTRTSICNKSRQIGLSHAAAFLGSFYGIYHGERTNLVSKRQEDSDEILIKATKHAQLLSDCGSRWAHPTAANTEALEFASGGSVLALPSTGGRGLTGHVVLDEYAYQENEGKTWDAAAPARTLGNLWLIVISTPNGNANKFAQLWADKDWGAGRVTRYEVPIEAAVAQGFDIDVDECFHVIANGDQRIYDQMYRCLFLDSSFQYLTEDLIQRLQSDTLVIPPGMVWNFAGLDIARKVNLTVLTVLGLHLKTRRLFTRWVEICGNTDSRKIDGMVGRAFKRFRLKRLTIDANGVGAIPAEDLRKKYGEKFVPKKRRPRVEPLDFTLQSKELLATGLFSRASSGLLWIPKTDAALQAVVGGGDPRGCASGTAGKMRDDLRAIKREVTPAQKVVYTSPVTPDGRHGDYAWSLALAVYAASEYSPMAAALMQ